MNGGKLHDRFKYRGTFRSLRGQAHFLKDRLGKGTVAFMKVGRYYELFDDDATGLGAGMGLKPVPRQRGFRWTAGFPARFRRHYVQKAIEAGADVAVIEEAGAGRFVKERRVGEVYRFGGSYA